MTVHIHSNIFRGFYLCILTAFVCAVLPPAVGLAAQSETVKAFLIKDMPDDFGKASRIFAAFQEAGANLVIVGQNVNKVPIPRKVLANMVFLAHQNNLKLYVVVPTRANSSLRASHPEWEDKRYDVKRQTVVPSRLIDLFNPDAQKAIVAYAKDAAYSSVDGILLGEDLLLAEGDGMGRSAMDAYRKMFNHEFNADRVFAVTEKMNEEYEGFIRMKQDELADVVRKIIAAAREVNRTVRFGIPLPFDQYVDVLDRLPEYRMTVKTFQGISPDFYWLELPHHEWEYLNYRKGMESIARTAMIVSDAIGDEGKAMIVLPLFSPSGRVLASTEVEEATEMSHKGGKTFAAYEVNSRMQLRGQLMKKLFREH